MKENKQKKVSGSMEPASPPQNSQAVGKENQNKHYNIKKQALGPNTKR